MPNRLLTSLYQYPEREQRRFMQAFEELPFDLVEKAEALRRIEAWLRKGVDAPTAMESATGWHKNLLNLVVEGEAGSVCITRMYSAWSTREPHGVDLDEWKPPAKKK